MTEHKMMTPSVAPADLKGISYPCRVLPWIDGVRACVVNGELRSRSGFPFPNPYVNELLSTPQLNGVDGMLTFGDKFRPDVHKLTRDVLCDYDGNSMDGRSLLVKFWIFDQMVSSHAAFKDRYSHVRHIIMRATFDGPDGLKNAVRLVPCLQASREDELREYASRWAEEGCSQLMIRSRMGVYKHGPSTAREGGMRVWKITEKACSEAIPETVHVP